MEAFCPMSSPHLLSAALVNHRRTIFGSGTTKKKFCGSGKKHAPSSERAHWDDGVGPRQYDGDRPLRSRAGADVHAAGRRRAMRHHAVHQHLPRPKGGMVVVVMYKYSNTSTRSLKSKHRSRVWRVRTDRAAAALMSAATAPFFSYPIAARCTMTSTLVSVSPSSST